MTPVQIKICGITNVRDAKACVDLGAQLIGLNFWPQSPRYIQPDTARQIVDALPADVTAVGVFVDGNAEEIRKTANTLAFARFVILSGGLNPQNVARAIQAVMPQAVDVCSGVERTPGVKDHRAIKDFVAAVREL